MLNLWQVAQVVFARLQTEYVVTTAEAVASGDTVIAQFTVPGGTWRNGEKIIILGTTLNKNNSGAARSTLIKLKVGDGALDTVSTANWSDSATEIFTGGVFSLRRIGSKVTVSIGMPDAPSSELWQGPGGWNNHFGSGTNYHDVSPTTFANDMVIQVVVNLATTHATYYSKPQSVYAVKVPSWI